MGSDLAVVNLPRKPALRTYGQGRVEGLADAKLAQCFIGQLGETILRRRERFRPLALRFEFGKQERSHCVLFGFRQPGSFTESAFEEWWHRMDLIGCPI